MLRRVVVAAALTLALAGCATPYQEFRWYSGGYGETQLTESEYHVFFRDLAQASVLRVRAFWLYRCAELTVEKGYDLMQLSGGSGVEARVQRGGVLRVGGFAPPLLPMPPPNALPPSRFGGVVSMYRRPLPDDLPYALDARRVIELLTPYVESDGKSGDLGFEAILLGTLVAHETVTLSLELPDAAPADSTPARRDPAEVRARLGSLDTVLNLHAVFRDRALSDPLAGGGVVELGFRVDPDGSVSACFVLAATLTDPELVEDVRRAVSEIRFDERDVAPMDAKLSIAFVPVAPQLRL